MLNAEKLRTEYHCNPLGMDEREPHFSWRATGNSNRQTEYRIRVKKADGETVWDSGYVKSAESVQIRYTGKPLERFTRYSWSVQLKDENGKAGTAGAEKAFFETGFMGTQWQAKWITGKTNIGNMRPLQRLAKDFTISKKIKQARLYISALGLYEAWINGKPVTENCMTPGWTQYFHRVQYQAYDVTELVKKSGNALGVTVGDGWYAGFISRNWNEGKATYGDMPGMIAELAITYADGSEERVLSDKSWQASSMEIAGAFRSSDIYMGETYDAMIDDTEWKQYHAEPRRYWNEPHELKQEIRIEWQSGANIRRMMELNPARIIRRGPGTYIVDFGQNLTGRERFTVRGACAGTTIVIKHGEMLNPDGSLYRANLRSAAANTMYTCGGGKEETYEPHFTYYGFRYLEISGWPGTLTKDMIRVEVLYSELEQTGKFQCSDKMLNQLYSNIVWGQRSNFVDVPTDCPQRDERQGWTGDTQVFANVATYNMDAAAFYSKWIKDLNLSLMRKCQCYPNFAPDPYTKTGAFWDLTPATGWGDAGIICPWVMYAKYGDLRPFTDNLKNICHHLDWQIEYAGGMIVDNACFGDWLNDNAPTPGKLLSTAYMSGMNRLVAKMAAAAGMNQVADERNRLADQIAAVFRKEFYEENGDMKVKTQTAALLALTFGLCPENGRKKTAEFLAHDIRVTRNLHLSTGFMGTPLLLKELTGCGEIDLAYELLTQTTYPGWLYSVTQGATTMWERWNSWTEKDGFGDVCMNSFNHYAYGAVGEWFYDTICGIRPDTSKPEYKAFKHFLLEPQFGHKLDSAKGEFDSAYGRIVSGWTRKDKEIVWRFEVPRNTSASIRLPAGAELVSGTGNATETANGGYEAGPGIYRWVIGY